MNYKILFSKNFDKPTQKKYQRYSSESGFTLLEMVLSMAIFTMIMLTIITGYFSVQQTWKKMTKMNSQIRVYLILDRVFDTAFRNSVPFTWTDDNFSSKSIFIGDEDQCTLAYIHRISNPIDGGIRFLKIYLEKNNLVASYRKTPIIPWEDDLAEIQSEILSTNVRRISFLYANFEKDELDWLDDWNEEAKSHPVAIQITVEWNNGTTERWLRRTAGAGKFESFGKRTANKSKFVR